MLQKAGVPEGQIEECLAEVNTECETDKLDARKVMPLNRIVKRYNDNNEDKAEIAVDAIIGTIGSAKVVGMNLQKE
eukprot:1143262-Amphidinium_carterae.1